ncbi:ABC-type transport auxiliary lipoprotein family protein [Thermaurantiacus sp.]
MSRAALLLGAGLAACGPLVQIGAPAAPPALHVLSLTAPASVPAGLGTVSRAEALTLIGFASPADLQTVRLPIRVSETEVQYLKDASWAEPPARAFGRLVAETLVASGYPVLDRGIVGRAGGHQLGGELSDFHVDVRGAPRVRVRFKATLTGPDGIRQRIFERDAPLDRVDGPAAARALNAAANAVAADMAAWVGSAGLRPVAGAGLEPATSGL